MPHLRDRGAKDQDRQHQHPHLPCLPVHVAREIITRHMTQLGSAPQGLAQTF